MFVQHGGQLAHWGREVNVLPSGEGRGSKEFAIFEVEGGRLRVDVIRLLRPNLNRYFRLEVAARPDPYRLTALHLLVTDGGQGVA